MRFLADAGISPETVVFLARLGHDVVHVRTLGMHRAPDRAITDHARADARVVLTFEDSRYRLRRLPIRPG